MTRSLQIAPSILSADFLNLERDVRLLTESAEPPEWLHIDVMDGHFVPNLTIGPAFVRALKRITTVPLDVHLMIDNPAEQGPWFVDAGADLITIHVEAVQPDYRGLEQGTSMSVERLSEDAVWDLSILLERIRESGARAGLSLNPGTPVQVLKPFYSQLDLVLLMSVHPGFGGQSFIPGSLERIAQIAADAADTDLTIEVDGGIDEHTAPQVVAAGATMLVAGNAIYGRPDPVAALAALRRACHLSQMSKNATFAPATSLK